MSFKIKLDALAKLKIEDNIDWYEEQQPGLNPLVFALIYL